jgi:hypothetical protein
MNSDRLDAAGLLARFAALYPVAATATGIHDHDGEWDRFGAAADARARLNARKTKRASGYPRVSAAVERVVRLPLVLHRVQRAPRLLQPSRPHPLGLTNP